MSVNNENTVKKSLSDYKAEKKSLKEQQEVQRIKASQIGTQNYYQTEYKNICEKQQQQILDLLNKDKKSQEIIQDLQTRLNYYMSQQCPVDNVQIQTDYVEQQEQVPQILQEYPQQQQQDQSPQTINVPKFIPISEKKAILQKRRWTYQGKLVHILRYCNLGRGKYARDVRAQWLLVKNGYESVKMPCDRTIRKWKNQLMYKLWTNQANTHIKL
ncbi:Hypothetical_protein [Hexamita inflata]|uniref:Hypothetical_protein n=1 Tax=Hexamita inflata TaxID=28002 RepID=A0AA86NG87_9EUKA|nr:Hypothetical protein HINF_LOCUS6173 [Hexamita inflata]